MVHFAQLQLVFFDVELLLVILLKELVDAFLHLPYDLLVHPALVGQRLDLCPKVFDFIHFFLDGASQVAEVRRKTKFLQASAVFKGWLSS